VVAVVGELAATLPVGRLAVSAGTIRRSKMHRIPPIRRQLVVPVGADLAFSVFADEIGAWWPVGEGYSVFGAGSMVSVKDGFVVEIGPDGSEAVWGTILDWGCCAGCVTWHPGKEPQTRARSGPLRRDRGRPDTGDAEIAREALAQPAETQRGHFRGWPAVLGHFHGLASQNQVEAGAGDVWFACSCARRGDRRGQRIFSHPDFRSASWHAARRGLLVAAGDRRRR
jgi:hypothetical protein